MVNVWNLKPGAAIRIVKTFRDRTDNEFAEGRVLHFIGRHYLPYHSGHTVYFREATMYLCDDDETSAIVENRDGEYFVVTEQSDSDNVCRDSQIQATEDKPTRLSAGVAPGIRRRGRYKTLLAGMLAVSIAFAFAIPLGFWLRPRYPALSDQLLAAIVVVILFAVAAGTMRLLLGPLWPRKKRESAPARFPDPDMDPTFEWPSNGTGCRRGYEISFQEFRRLVSDPACQPVIAPLLRDWYRYEIGGEGPETVVRSEEGQVVGLRVLHNKIQIDPPKQQTIYNRAMDLWR